MKKEKTAIIILNFNGLPYILDCLESVFRFQDYKALGVEVMVVDNNSIDRSVELIRKQFPQVRVFKNKSNLGFAGGNNTGIKYALKNNFDRILLLNPDTIVVKDFLRPLGKLINSDKKIGIVAPVLIGKEGEKTIFALGAKVNLVLGRTKHKHLIKKPKNPLEQELVSGCCMLVKKEVFEKIGLLDERFFLYFEDSDFCLRAKKAGYKIYVEPKSFIFHKTSQSLGGLSLKKIKYNLWSNFLFINKHVKPYFLPVAYFYLLVLGLKMIVNVFWSKKIWPENIIPGWHSFFAVNHHLTRYYFSLKFIKKSDLVLDAACGSGYGSQILAQKAKKVFSIDKSKKILCLAKLKYRAKNIVYQEMDCCQNLVFKDSAFDKVISFETIEHLPDPEKFLSEVKRILKPKGLFIISTPNQEVCSPNFPFIDNPWHLREYKIGEFRNLLAPYFRKITIYSQTMAKSAKDYQQKHEEVQDIKRMLIKNDKFIIRKILPRFIKEFIWNKMNKLMLLKSQKNLSYKDFPIEKGVKQTAPMFLAVCRNR